MADLHPVACSKCKKPGTPDKSECGSCGGRVVRTCGSCGFKNAAAKKYCDACGENFLLAPKAPPPPPKAEPAKAPQPAPKPAPQQAPLPKPEPKPEPKAEPKAEPKPQIRLQDIRKPEPRVELPSDTEPEAKAEPKPEPKPPAKPEPRPEPKLEPRLEPKPEPKPSKDSQDEAMERYIPKTVISRIPKKSDGQRVVRDDEPVPDMRPPEKEPLPKDEPPPKDAGGPPPPPAKRTPVKMRLEGDPVTPLPKKLPEKPKEPPKEPPKDAPKPPVKPLVKGQPEELDPRLVKGYEGREPAPSPAPSAKDRPAASRDPEAALPRDSARSAAAPPKRVEGPSQTFIQRRPKAVFSTVMALVLLAAGFVVYGLKVKQKKSPAETLVKAAGDYLFALKQKDWPAAYSKLSAASRKAASLEAFKGLQDDSSWTFDDIKAEIVAPGWALVRYKLFGGSGGGQDDWLVMQLEEGQWRRAYWWTLMPELESALGRADHAGAARLAREAQAIDPLDPMPPAYYCEAARIAGDEKAALESCAKALKMAQSLPSRLGPEGIFRINHILADIERTTQNRPAEAVRSLALLLAYPRLDEAQRCDLTLAKAESEMQASLAADALDTFRQAKALCRLEADQSYAARSAAVLAGDGGPEAVALVQGHRMPGDEMTLAEWREKSRDELAKRLKTRPKDLPAEAWSAAHASGASYTVTLASGRDTILTAEVDLFTQKIKVDIHVQ